MKPAGAATALDERVPSPCINVCTMNPMTGHCDGCLRTIGEIAAWSEYSECEKREVLARLPARKTGR